MSVFNRLAGIEKPRLPLWKLISDFTRVMDGQVLLSELEYETGINKETAVLTEDELAESTEYLGAVAARIQSQVATILKGNMVEYRASLPANNPMHLSAAEVAEQTEQAILQARSIVRCQLEDYMMNAVHATMTVDQFRAQLGLPPLA